MMSLWKRARHVVRPAGWGVADQALSSLTNFVVGIYIARSLDTKEFGAFSLAFATYVIALNASRGGLPPTRWSSVTAARTSRRGAGLWPSRPE
jgi:hypothetical protein